MKRILNLTLSILVVLVLGYFIYKGIILFRYSTNSFDMDSFDSFIQAYKGKDIKKIIHEKADDYLEYGNIKIENKFKNFVKEDISGGDILEIDIYKLEENGELRAAFYIGEVMSYYDIFIADDKEFYGGIDSDTKLRDVSGINIKEVFDNNGIIDDITLFNYLFEYEKKDINIFTRTKEIKEYYAIMLIANVVFPEIDEFILYEGEYSGYAFNINDKYYEVRLLHEGNSYILTFSGEDYYSEEDIDLLLNSVVIE